MKKYLYPLLFIVLGVFISLVTISNSSNLKNTNLIFLQNKLHNFNYKFLRRQSPQVKYNEKLQNLKIHFTSKDINHFDTLYNRYQHPDYGYYSKTPKKNYGLDYYSKNNKRIKSELSFNGKKIKAKIKSHGKQPDLHNHNGFISLNIKIEEDIDELIQKKFKLIIYERVNYRKYYDEIIALSDNFDLERYPSNLLNVQIKGKPDHLYYLEHSLNKSNIKKIFPKKNFLFLKNIEGHLIIDSKNKTQANTLKKLSKSHDSLVYRKIILLNKFIKEKKQKDLISLFDFNYMANFEAFRIIGGFTGHGYEPENLEIFYNIDDGKFYPIIHRDFYFGRIDTCNVSLECLEKYRWDGGGKYGDDLTVFKIISKNKRLREEALKKVNIFLEHRQISFIEKIKNIRSIHEIRYYNNFILNMTNLTYFDDVLLNNIKFLEKKIFLNKSN